MTPSFAPDAIETWPLSHLQPCAKNAKAHGPEQVARIAASMAEFGWTVPRRVAEDGELIAGHGRLLAAGMIRGRDQRMAVTRPSWHRPASDRSRNVVSCARMSGNVMITMA